MMLIMISKVHVANDFDYCVYVADDGHLARSFGYKGAPPKKLKMILKNFHTFINVFLEMVMMLFHIREGGQNSWKLIYLISGPFLVLHGGKWFYMIEQFIQWSHYTGYRPAISSCRTQYILALRFYVVYLCVSWLFDFCFVSYLCTPLFCGACVTHNMCNRSPCLVCPIFVHLGFALVCDAQHVQ